MKLAVAMMQHETNTFSPLPTPYRAFAGPTGRNAPPAQEEALSAWANAGMAFSAFVDVARKIGAEIDVPIAAYAEPSGLVDADAFELICDRICDAVAKGCDGLLLDLHGAMVVDGYDDGEGELLRRIRHIRSDIPVAVALDFHANVTQAMIDNSTVLTGYRTYPHVDMYQTGERAAQTLLRAMRDEIEPRLIWRKMPLLTHMLKQTPSQEPMKAIMDLVIAAEDSGAVLNASVFGGFPLADIPHVCVAPVIVGNGSNQGAEELADRLAEMIWERREKFEFEIEPLTHSIARAKSVKQGPVILVDHGDNCGSGGPVDDMTVLGECLRQGLKGILAGPIWDPEAVQQMTRAGVGAEVTIPVGGKTACPAVDHEAKPMMLSGKVVAVSDGRFRIKGPMMTGLEVDLAGTAMLDTGAALVIVSSERCEPYDLGYLSHLGADPLTTRYLLIKSRQHFRAGFEQIAKEIILVAGPGVCSSDYDQFSFEKLSRPIYPLDRSMSWNAPRSHLHSDTTATP